MNTDFSSGPLDYSSAEFKRIPLKTLILFFLNTNRTNQTNLSILITIRLNPDVNNNPPHGKSIRVPKTFVLFELFVFKKAVRPSSTHQCRTQTDHLYLICHVRRLPFPSPDTTITITPLHHFTTFLPFTIYIP